MNFALILMGMTAGVWVGYYAGIKDSANAHVRGFAWFKKQVLKAERKIQLESDLKNIKD